MQQCFPLEGSCLPFHPQEEPFLFPVPSHHWMYDHLQFKWKLQDWDISFYSLSNFKQISQ